MWSKLDRSYIMRKIQRFPFTRFNRQLMSTYSENCNKQINRAKPSNSWDQHLENLLSIQHLHLKTNTFRSGIKRATSHKQTRSTCERKEIETLVIFRVLSACVPLESIRWHMDVLELYSACYVWLCSSLKINACFLRRCCLIWKSKQHTYGTFGLVNKKSSLGGSNSLRAGSPSSHASEKE